MIRACDLHKSYGETSAVRGVSFSAANGAITGMLGPNGAGKTTTLRMISSLVRPDSGEAWVDNVNVHRAREEALRKLGVLPDSRGLYPRLTTREHLRYFGQLQGMDSGVLEARIDELLTRLEMRTLADRRVEGFSQGERSKVALGRALVHNPRNLILDEPTNGLDVMSARALRSLVRSLVQDGLCVLFSSHVMPEVAELCDKLVIFVQGRVVHDGSSDALREAAGNSDLEGAFVRLVEQHSTPSAEPNTAQPERS